MNPRRIVRKAEPSQRNRRNNPASIKQINPSLQNPRPAVQIKRVEDIHTANPAKPEVHPEKKFVKFNLEEVRKYAYKLIEITNRLLTVYSGETALGIKDNEDAEQIQLTKDGFESSANNIIHQLLEMQRIQKEEIIPRCDELARASGNEKFRLQTEIHNFAKQNRVHCDWIVGRDEKYQGMKAHLTKQQEIKNELHQAFSNRLISAGEMDGYIENMGIVHLPEQFPKDHIVKFQFESISMKFLIVNVDEQDEKNKKIDLVHMNQDNSLEKSTARYFAGIPLSKEPGKNFSFYLKSKIVYARNEIQKGVAKARVRYIQQYGIENLKVRLRAYGLFTEEEIARMVGGKVEHSNIDIMRSISLAEKKVAHKLSTMIDEHGKPKFSPDVYEKGFKDTINQFISGIENSPITPEQKTASLQAIQKLIVTPIFNAMKVFGKIEKAEWAEWIRVLNRRIEKDIIANNILLQNQTRARQAPIQPINDRKSGEHVVPDDSRKITPSSSSERKH